MKSIIILFSVLALVITATKIRSHKELSSTTDQSLKNKEQSLNFLESSIHHHFKQSLEKAENSLDEMLGDYQHFEYSSQGSKFPFGLETTEIQKVSRLLPILKKTSTIKSWNLGSSVRFSEIKDKISESAQKLTNMFSQGHKMVRKMVSNAPVSRFISKSLFSTFRTFVSLSSATKVYTELLESINLSAEMSNKIASEAANTVKTNMMKDTRRKGSHGTKKVGDVCNYKWFSSDSECADGLKCHHNLKKCVTVDNSRGNKQIGEVCDPQAVGQGSDCAIGECHTTIKLCLIEGKDTKLHGIFKMNEKCTHHMTTASECQDGLECSNTHQVCVASEGFFTEIKAKLTTLFTTFKDAVKTATTAIGKSIITSIKQQSTDKSAIEVILQPLYTLRDAVDAMLLALYDLVDQWVAAVAIGLEVKGTLTIAAGSASINYAIARSGHGSNYWYGEACGGFQFNFGVGIEAALVVTIIHEPIEEGEKEYSSALGVSFEIDLPPVKLAIGVNANFKKKTDGSHEMSSVTVGVGVGVGASVLPVTLSASKCVAKRF